MVKTGKADKLTYKIYEYKLDAEVTLAGSFCTGQCNRYGVTVQIDDEIYTGLKVEDFKEFFRDKVLRVLGKKQ